MPRTSWTPMKVTDRQTQNMEPAEVTIAVVTHIPHNYEHYAQKLEVLKLCLHSIWAHTNVPYDLMIMDNGSAPHVRRYLLDLFQNGAIKFLVLNQENVGLMRAIDMLIGMVPGKYLAFANDDIFFYPNWLSEHLRVLEAFPRVGFVSGEAVPDKGHEEMVERIAHVEGVHFEPYEYPLERIQAWCYSTGKDVEQFIQSKVKNSRAFTLERNGIKAITGDRCYAWVAKKEFLRQVPVQDLSQPIGGDRYWHRQADELGYSRLSTCERLTAHIGNSLDETWVQWAQRLGALNDAESAAIKRAAIAQAKRNPLGKRMAKRILFSNPVTRRLSYWTLHRLAEVAS